MKEGGSCCALEATQEGALRGEKEGGRRRGQKDKQRTLEQIVGFKTVKAWDS